MPRSTSVHPPASSRTGARTHLDTRRPRALAWTLLAALVLAGVSLIFAGSAETKPNSNGPTLTVRASKYGRVLFDGRGLALYAFTADPKRRSVCAGACAAAWPPYLVKGTLHAGRGVEPARLGAISRVDGGRQLTYAGRLLYHYVGDKKPGQILCQGVTEFGGDWLVVRPGGALVR